MNYHEIYYKNTNRYQCLPPEDANQPHRARRESPNEYAQYRNDSRKLLTGLWRGRYLFPPNAALDRARVQTVAQFYYMRAHFISRSPAARRSLSKAIPAESQPLYSNRFSPLTKVSRICLRVLGYLKFKYPKIPSVN